MAIKAVGILNLHRAKELGLLTATRSIASTSFLGRYAFMDFALSNFSNSGIDRTAVLVKEHIRSIIQHIGEGHEWNENSKLGGLTLLYDEPYATSPLYNHDINNLIENSWYLKSIDADVVVFAPAHIIYKMDFAPLIEEHTANNHKITLLYSHVDNAKDSFIGEDEINVEDGMLKDMHPNLGSDDEADIFLQTVIIDKEVLNGFLRLGQKTSSIYDLRDVLMMLSKNIPVYCRKFEGPVFCFDSLEHYLSLSQKFLTPEVMDEFFSKDWPIYTKTYDTPPARYGAKANVKGSFISNGCIIEGTVINSIIARDVVVKPGAVIKDSVILSGSYISEWTHLENVVCDKEARVIHVKEIKGTLDKVQFIKRGDIV